jgi:hypothetical protein
MTRLRDAFPYLFALALWNLPDPRLNPFGILAIIPVFYYMFCDRKKYWFPFGLLICFLLDYNAGTLFLFGSFFLFMNAINGAYGVLDVEADSVFNIKKFNLFMGIMTLFLFICAIFDSNQFWGAVAGIIWLYFWLMLLYAPFVALFKRVKK